MESIFTHFAKTKNSSLFKQTPERFNELDLCRWLHSFEDDFVEAVGGSFAEERSAHEAEEERHEAIVDNERNINPRDVGANYLQALTHDDGVTRVFVSRLKQARQRRTSQSANADNYR